MVTNGASDQSWLNVRPSYYPPRIPKGSIQSLLVRSLVTPLAQVKLPPIEVSSVKSLTALPNSWVLAWSKSSVINKSLGSAVCLKFWISSHRILLVVGSLAPQTAVSSKLYPPLLCKQMWMNWRWLLTTCPYQPPFLYPTQIESLFSSSEASSFICISQSMSQFILSLFLFSNLNFVSIAEKISTFFSIRRSLRSLCLSTEHVPLRFHDRRDIAPSVILHGPKRLDLPRHNALIVLPGFTSVLP